MDKYEDRSDAGEVLATHLKEVIGNIEHGIVLALPRGGVPVADKIAKKFRLPLNVLVVRKLGHPENPEFAIGAIASGGGKIIHLDKVSRLNISQSQMEKVIEKEKEKLEKRERLYNKERKPLDLEGKRVILVDDGIATGASMQVAIEVLKDMDPSEIIVAVPVAPQKSLSKISKMVDKVECPLQPRLFGAIGRFYNKFGQTSNEEVKEILSQYP